jgi:hypothetical protein
MKFVKLSNEEYDADAAQGVGSVPYTSQRWDH